MAAYVSWRDEEPSRTVGNGARLLFSFGAGNETRSRGRRRLSAARRCKGRIPAIFTGRGAEAAPRGRPETKYLNWTVFSEANQFAYSTIWLIGSLVQDMIWEAHLPTLIEDFQCLLPLPCCQHIYPDLWQVFTPTSLLLLTADLYYNTKQQNTLRFQNPSDFVGFKVSECAPKHKQEESADNIVCIVNLEIRENTVLLWVYEGTNQ